MNLVITNSSGKPIYEQIGIQIKNKIASGELEPGAALPSMRLLAKELRISVITTKRAYEDLERDGYIYTIVGKGSFVATQNLEFMKEQQLKDIEVHLQEAVDMAIRHKVSCKELNEIISVLYEEYGKAGRV